MNTTKKKILGISGSTKAASTSLAILRHIATHFEELIDLEIYNKIGELPHFNPDLDKTPLPKAVATFRALIETADAILFCTPEYVFSLPGSLKNAIEWNVSTVLFSGKPAAMIVAAASGEKAFDSLGLVLTTLEMILPMDSRLLIQGAKGKWDKDGHLNNDATHKQIKAVVESLLKTIDEKTL